MKAKPVHPSKAGKVPSAPQPNAQEPRKRAGRVSQPQSPEQGDKGRASPHSVDAELGILSSIMLAPRDVIGICREKITPGHFVTPAHQTIYNAFVHLDDQHQAVDLITFTQYLRDSSQLEEVGGPSFVTSLLTFVPTPANARYYIDILREKFILREIIRTSSEAIQKCYELPESAVDILGEAEKALFSLHECSTWNNVWTAKNASQAAMDAIQAAYENPGSILGISTGLRDLDRIINGMQSTDMIVVAGRPSMGKTALAMNIVEHVAIEQKLPVGVFSIEMSAQQLMQRMICSRANVNLQKVTQGLLRDRDIPALVEARVAIAASPLFIDEQRLDIQTLSARARKMRSDHGIKLVVIDYLQLLRARGFRPNERQTEVAFISAAIKELAKSLKIPVVVLAQLNRNPEGRTGGKPRLSDLRESGSIEQDADIVGLLHRPEVYAEDDEEKKELEGLASLEIAKARNGPIGEVPLVFRKELTRFEDRARSVVEQEQLKIA